MNIKYNDVQEAAKKCLIKAGTTYREDQLSAYRKALASESLSNSRWVLERILENAEIAEHEQLPLCDDTGIPHVIVQLGEACALPKGWLAAIQKGIAQGLREMPGRPMAVCGDDIQRIEQSSGLHPDPAALDPAPIILFPEQGDQLKLTVLLLGGGPEIRARTRRIFHRHSMDHVISEIATWFVEEIGSLGCTPTVAAVGIGRSQVEASTMMLKAMAEGSLNEQNELEKKITDAINHTGVGPLNLGGDTTALGCFLKVGPIRAGGVRIVCARPCCCVEVRRATTLLG
jgi:fumarate hydratase subunit alpha